MFLKQTPLDPSCSEAKKITNHIARMLVSSYLPYRFVEEQGFRDLMNHIKPNYVVPSSTTFSRNVVPTLYASEKDRIRRTLEGDISQVGSISLTTDNWTSRATDSYASLTCHYAVDFNYKTFTLGMVEVEGSHTSANLRTLLSDLTASWNIPGPQEESTVKVFMVTDNARNLRSAIENTNWVHRPCFAHTLQLAIKDGIDQTENVKKVLAKGRSIVAHYSRSSVATARLENELKNKGLPCLKLIKHVDTRWSSELAMLERLMLLKEAVVAELTSSGADIDCYSNTEWKVVESVVGVLKPFSEATANACGNFYPTASMIIPTLHCLDASLVSFVVKNTFQPGVPFARCLMKCVKSRFPLYKKDSVNVVCTVVDPRFKDALFTQEDEKTNAHLLLKQECRLYPPSELTPGPEECGESSASSSLWAALDSLPMQEAPSHSQENAEITTYLSSARVARTVNPYEWWKQNKHQYPNIAEVATRYLPIPATQVASERMFSVSGNIVTQRRELLRPDHVEQLTFLHDNFKHNQ